MKSDDIRVLVLDDDPAIYKRIKPKLERLLKSGGHGHDLNIAESEGQFKSLVEVLLDRQNRFRDGEAIVYRDYGSSSHGQDPLAIDDVDILVIDYDLIKYSPTTGESLAYLIRAFTDCGLILEVNQFGSRSFDLTLRGNLSSFADLNLGIDHLTNPGLWEERLAGFRPWAWPNVVDFLKKRRRCVNAIEKNISAPALAAMGFGKEEAEGLPRSVSQFLGSEPEKTSFLEFVRNTGNGLRTKDAKALDQKPGRGPAPVVARVAAARLAKWMEHSVLPRQDILVDAPHLAWRYPSLLRGPPTQASSWRATETLGPKPGIMLSPLTKAAFAKPDWLSRPAWFGGRLVRDEGILEVREPWAGKRADLVFCEDASRFYPRSKCREFVADMDTPFARRFVKEFRDKADYKPAVRFAMLSE